MANNIFQQRIKPVTPKILENERIFVYVPKATTKDAGIAYYNPDDFTVSNLGKVSIIWPYAHDGKFGLVQIANDSTGYLKFTEDVNHYLEVDIDKLDLHTNELINTKILEHNNDENAHSDIKIKLDELGLEITNSIEAHNISEIAHSNLFNKKIDKEIRTKYTVDSNTYYKYSLLNNTDKEIVLSRENPHIDGIDNPAKTGYTVLELNDNIRLYTNNGLNFDKFTEASFNHDGEISLTVKKHGITNQLKISDTSVNINEEEIATENFVEEKIKSINTIEIRNKEPNLVIEATSDTIQTVANQYIIDNYMREPKANDGLFITRVDLDNDIIKYAYFNNSWVNIGINKIDLSNLVDLTSEQVIAGNKDFIGKLTKNGDDVATINDLEIAENNARTTLILGATGTIGDNANFVIEDAESYIGYRNNLTEFLFSGIIPVTGEVDLTKEVTITFGDTSYYLFDAIDTTKRLTLNDLKFALKESLVTGYNYLFKTIFFNNSDLVGFAVLPDRDEVLSLDSDQMDSYLADGGLPNGQLAICNKVIVNGYSEGSIYRFKITYPSTYEWEEISGSSGFDLSQLPKYESRLQINMAKEASLNGLLTLPIYESSNFYVDWGDGTNNLYTEATTEITHQYENTAFTGWIIIYGEWKGTNFTPEIIEGTSEEVDKPSSRAIISVNIEKFFSDTIPAYAFYGCTKLLDVTLGSIIKKISNNAFEGCSILVSVNTSDSVTGMGDYAFRNCINLRTIKMPKCGSNLFQGTFSGCNQLVSVELPIRLSRMRAELFSNCSNLRTVTIPGVPLPVQLISDNEENPVFPDNVNQIFVPTRFLYSYKTGTNWTRYADKIYPIGGQYSETVLITTDLWVDNTATARVIGSTTDSRNIIEWTLVDSNGIQVENTYGIKATAQGTMTMTFTCETVPTEEVRIFVKSTLTNY